MSGVVIGALALAALAALWGLFTLWLHDRDPEAASRCTGACGACRCGRDEEEA